MAKIQKFLVNEERTEQMKAISNVGAIIRRRPFVSAKNPHKCDEEMMPAKLTAPKIPLSCVDKFKSHSDTGITKLIPHDSIKEAFKIIPQMKIKK